VRSAQVGAAGVALTLAALAARTFGTGALARWLAPSALRAEAPLASAFKNIALVAAVAGSLHGPAAALPALLALPLSSATSSGSPARRRRPAELRP